MSDARLIPEEIAFLFEGCEAVRGLWLHRESGNVFVQLKDGTGASHALATTYARSRCPYDGIDAEFFVDEPPFMTRRDVVPLVLDPASRFAAENMLEMRKRSGEKSWAHIFAAERGELMLRMDSLLMRVPAYLPALDPNDLGIALRAPVWKESASKDDLTATMNAEFTVMMHRLLRYREQGLTPTFQKFTKPHACVLVSIPFSRACVVKLLERTGAHKPWQRDGGPGVRQLFAHLRLEVELDRIGARSMAVGLGACAVALLPEAAANVAQAGKLAASAVHTMLEAFAAPALAEPVSAGVPRFTAQKPSARAEVPAPHAPPADGGSTREHPEPVVDDHAADWNARFEEFVRRSKDKS